MSAIQASQKSTDLDTGKYIRSHIFTAHSGVNPLCTAAQPLLSLALRLQKASSMAERQAFLTLVNHELEAFETRSLALEYTAETVLVAKYVLSVTLAELVERAHWEMPLATLLPALTDHPGQAEPRQNLYLIIEKILNDPQYHIDLLEVCYLCISAAFQDDFPKFEKLYIAIREQRGDFKKELLITSLPDTPLKKKFRLPWWLSVFASVCLIGSSYLALNYLITHHSASLALELQRITDNHEKT
jgi:type IV/VI secretion system ImpK/VasF family protein